MGVAEAEGGGEGGGRRERGADQGRGEETEKGWVCSDRKGVG